MTRTNLEGARISNTVYDQGFKMGVTRLADANATISLNTGPVLSITPSAARTLTLPVVTPDMRGLVFFVVNAAAFAITVQNATPATVGVVPATVGATGMFVCLGDTTLGAGGWSGGL